LRRGDGPTAEREYEDAAATVQTPESYVRLLLVSTLTARRRARIESLLDGLVDRDERERMILEARRDFGLGVAIFGDDAEKTGEPIEVRAA
jgi:hypothetical protein